jgi:hypothetical protein
VEQPRIFSATIVFAARDESEAHEIAGLVFDRARGMLVSVCIVEEFDDDEARELGWIGDGSVLGPELDHLREQWDGDAG